ncbi:uncharacterized protein LOC133197863 [Saccostrea echinata]|uniref:uncharacterized protein LOC133197863 n=1 Tax=Saccostrea echinata TaxID=191078 RepID=UPI002A7FE0FE|nr:uncharacterized protein LOC133197863 [Saccostrea echinata]
MVERRKYALNLLLSFDFRISALTQIRDNVTRNMKELIEMNKPTGSVKALACHPRVPGLSVAVVKDNQVLISKGYGLADLQTGTPVTEFTLFRLASITKAVSTTLLAKQLHETSNYNLYSHLTSFYDSSFKFSTTIRTENANIRDILSHALAIPKHNYLRLNPKLNRTNFPSVLKNLKSVYPFRETYTYTNIAFGLSTTISEKIGRQPWEDLVRQELFSPLGMHSSTFFSETKGTNHVAKGYIDDVTKSSTVPVPSVLYNSWEKLCGSICLMSNAHDMAKWMKFHLSGGLNEHGSRVMQEETLKSTYKARNSISSSGISEYFSKPRVPHTTTENNYALGWRNGYYREYKILRHTGTILGFSSLVTLIPDMNIGIFTTMNGQDSDYIFRTLLHNYLADIALGEDAWLNSSTICSFPKPWFSLTPSASHHISKSNTLSRSSSEYVGHYHNNAYGDLHIFLNSTTGIIDLKYGIATWNLYPKHSRDQFAAQGYGILENISPYDLATIKFHHDTHGGSIISVEVTSFEPKDPPIFSKVSSSVGSSVIFGK